MAIHAQDFSSNLVVLSVLLARIMAQNDNSTYTRRLSRKIDAAYKAYVAGKPLADRQLFSAFRDQARNVLWYPYQLTDEHLAAEIAGQAFMALGQFRGESLCSTWFFKLARRERANAFRTLSRRREVPIEQPVKDGEPGETKAMDVQARPANDDTVIDVARLRKGLPPAQGEVLDLHDKGYTLEEIAKKTGKSLGTIRSRYRLAKNKMLLRARRKK